MSRPLRMAMVGGGPGSFIGPVHRMAAALDGRFVLIAGAFSSDVERCRETAARAGIDPARAYPDYRSMLQRESARADGADLIAIVTPNHLHFPVARAALEAGFHVMSDKPATLTLAEAHRLAETVARSGKVYALSHTYTGYAMVRQARAMVASGALGRIRKVVVEYSQGWLSRAIEREGSRQAEWRADPLRSGIGGCIADIGVHAFNLAEYVSGQRIVELCADLSAHVAGRTLDDDANLLLRFDDHASGVLHASQIAAGDRNGMRLRIWGEAGGLDWSHERPDRLTWEAPDAPTRLLHAASPYLAPAAGIVGRLPPGHPEGFIEAFANLYAGLADAVEGATELVDGLLPGIRAAVRGMAFIETAVASSAARRWLTIGE